MRIGCIQNDNVVEDTPGTTNYSNFFVFYEEFLCFEGGVFQFVSCFLNRSIEHAFQPITNVLIYDVHIIMNMHRTSIMLCTDTSSPPSGIFSSNLFKM